MSSTRQTRSHRVRGLRVALEVRSDAVEDESILHRDFWRVSARAPRRTGVPVRGLRLVSTSERLMS